MPNFNGQGPQGAGPMTGRGMGPCAGGRAFGRGCLGRGRGFFGRGRGFRSGFGAGSQDEKQYFTDYLQDLEAEMTEVKDYLASLEDKK